MDSFQDIVQTVAIQSLDSQDMNLDVLGGQGGQEFTGESPRGRRDLRGNTPNIYRGTPLCFHFSTNQHTGWVNYPSPQRTMEKKNRKKIVPGDHTGPRIMPVSNSLSGIPCKECSMSQSPRTGLLHYHGIKINSRLNGALVLPHKSWNQDSKGSNWFLVT